MTQDERWEQHTAELGIVRRITDDAIVAINMSFIKEQTGLVEEIHTL